MTCRENMNFNNGLTGVFVDTWHCTRLLIFQSRPCHGLGVQNGIDC